ncbi:MAG: methyltransferase domain-containing protein [Bacteroidetes bacterium]|nr:methyltransferase domain-containing protein [Bacteroidota bacterium]
MCTIHQIDTQKQEAFGEELIDMLNKASISIMLSVGHRTGLLDSMRDRQPATSREIAHFAGLDERYVREWLGAMSTGGIVRIHQNGGEPRYALPSEHAGFLTRAAGADNIGVFAQYIGMLGTVEDDIVHCFRSGGGVPYTRFRRFHEVMAEDSGQTVVGALLDGILPLVPGLTARLQEGIDVLDVGCGMGRAVVTLAAAFPRSRFTGYDLSPAAITAAKASALARDVPNAHFEVRDLTTFDEDAPAECYNLITSFDAIHDQARPDRVLRGIARALKPGGTYLMQDISASSEHAGNMNHPIAPFLYTISTMHCMTVSLAQGGMGLGTMWGREKAREMLTEAGFGDISIHRLEHDFQNEYYVTTRPLLSA